MQSSKPPRPKLSNWPPQSPQTVLIRNLQLLELDQLQDWPGITLRTLSPSSQNQRQRVKAVEWILYQLVALWDPDTARDKLRAFFPPLEPLQSVNLRAALFRVLSDFKKNGDLGREIILRKSMLDDCKGEKFDELLASFSTSVVRKRKIDHRNPAIDLSLAPGLTPQEYALLLPLILAHRVSLNTLVERQGRVLDAHQKFSKLLDREQEELDSRSATDSHSHALHIQDADLEALARETKANWQGSVEWADALLYGGLSSGRDAFLELPFEKAWSRAKESTVDELPTTTTRPDLVMDLETRVLRQQARLQRWRQYTASLKRPETASSSTPIDATKSAPQLVFRDHQSLTVASISKAVRQPISRNPPAPNDQTMLRSISEAMERINGPSPKPSSVPQPESESSYQIPSTPPSHSVTETRASKPQDDRNTEIKPAPAVITISEYPKTTTEPPAEREEQREQRPVKTLVERTRKSMSLLPPPREEPKPHPRRSRQSRVSFPVNQFETTARSSTDFPSRASTPRDELFDDQADYLSVFKSRPRVALSPVASPAVHVSVSPLGDFDLDTSTDADDMDYVGVGSPLASRGRYQH